MALHKKITCPGLYFITFTCYRWLPLIEIVNGYDLVYKWFDILVSAGHAITGYVIMPNHLHVLVYYNGGSQSLNTIVGNGKRFMAYGIVKRLKAQKKYEVLAILERGVCASDRRRGKKHEVWEDAFDAKECRTDDFAFQKLQYIHNNPCAGKWKLAESIIDYLHSSALFYITWQQGIYPVRDYREFLKFDEGLC
jgi:REP element-mobilizing transposase RayT